MNRDKRGSDILKELSTIDIKCGTDQLYDDFVIPSSKYDNFKLALKDYENRATVTESFPPFLVIGPTNVCNLKCTLCPTTHNTVEPTGFMDFGAYTAIIDEAAPYSLGVSLYNWGESLLHPNLVDMIRYAHEKQMLTRISSNLSLQRDEDYFRALCESGLDILRVDLDGMTQATYEAYRRLGKVDLVKRNLERMCELRARLNVPMKIEVVMLAFSHNEQEFHDFTEYCSQLAIDKSIISKIKINPEQTREWLPEDSSYVYDNYLDDTAYPEDNRCSRIYFTAVVEWNGDVMPCCTCYGTINKFGNMFESGQTLRDIWNNERFVAARSLFTQKPISEPVTLCHKCKNRLGSPSVPRINGSWALSLP